MVEHICQCRRMVASQYWYDCASASASVSVSESMLELVSVCSCAHTSVFTCFNVCVDAVMYVGEVRRARGRTGVAPIMLTHVSTCTTHACMYSQMPMMRYRPRQCPPAEPWYPSLAVVPGLQQPLVPPKLMTGESAHTGYSMRVWPHARKKLNTQWKL